jgi:Xaa-Pro aminopeptidase
VTTVTTEGAAIAPQLARRRAAAAAAWDLSDEVVVVGAGEPIGVPGRGDVTYPYRAHTEYFYLTDRNRPGGVLAFDPNDGWFDFVAPITVAERLWSGAPPGEQEGLPLPELAAWLKARAGRRLAALGARPEGLVTDGELSDELRFRLSDVRLVKDEVELGRMRAAERATAAGFAALVALLRDGLSERELQIELEAAFFRHGAAATAYDTIIASGPNSAVLHSPPSSRRMRAGELVLIDAGAEHLGYASDITRTYPVDGQLCGEQRELHALVHAAQRAAIDRCTPGTAWHEVHLAAAAVIADGLAGLGILRGRPDALVQGGAVWLFFPHGIGHLVGLGVRDAGPGLRRRKEEPPAIPTLRFDLPLRPGMVVTVEPGIYFVPAILEDPEQREQYAAEVDWDRVDRMLDFGGIRIEDNLVITDRGHEVITGDVPVLGSAM